MNLNKILCLFVSLYSLFILILGWGFNNIIKSINIKWIVIRPITLFLFIVAVRNSL